MKNMVYIIIILFVLPCLTSAGEIYTYKNKQGVTVISNEPPPDEIKDKAKKVESYTPDSPAAIAAFQRKQKEAEDRAFRGWQSSQRHNQQNYSSQSSVQESRNKRAQKVIDDTRARLQAVKDSGFNLPNKNINIVENAAEEKARQIKAGTDTPMSPQEDADFHRRQEQYELESKIRQQQYEIDRLKRGW